MRDEKIYKNLLTGCTLRQRDNRNKRYSHCLYAGTMPVLQVTKEGFARIYPLLKKGKKGYTLNLNHVRQLNGHHTCNILYKEILKAKT